MFYVSRKTNNFLSLRLLLSKRFKNVFVEIQSECAPQYYLSHANFNSFDQILFNTRFVDNNRFGNWFVRHVIK